MQNKKIVALFLSTLLLASCALPNNSTSETGNIPNEDTTSVPNEVTSEKPSETPTEKPSEEPSETSSEAGTIIPTPIPDGKLNQEQLFEWFDKFEEYCKTTERNIQYRVNSYFESESTSPKSTYYKNYQTTTTHFSSRTVDVNYSKLVAKHDFTIKDTIKESKINPDDNLPVPPGLELEDKEEITKGIMYSYVIGQTVDSFAFINGKNYERYTEDYMSEYEPYTVYTAFHKYDVYNQTIDMIEQSKEAITTKDSMNPNGVAFTAVAKDNLLSVTLDGVGYGVGHVVYTMEFKNFLLTSFDYSLYGKDKDIEMSCINKITYTIQDVNIEEIDKTLYGESLKSYNPYYQ